MARVYSFINGNPSHDEDLRSNKGGKVKCGKKSGFIRRLMAENALKHEGQYKNPTFPLHPRSTMFHQAEFKYKDLANEEQDGNRDSEYGASPFIIKHFGQAEPVPFERKRGVAPPSEPYGRPRGKPRGEPQESEEQREARRGFVEKKAEAKPEPSKEEAKEVVKHSTSAKVKPAPVAKDEVDEKYGVEGDRTGDELLQRLSQRRDERRRKQEEDERQRTEVERLKAEAEAKKPKESALHNKKQYIGFDDIRGLKLDGEESTYPAYGNIDSVKTGRQFMMSSGKPFGSGWGIGTPALYKGLPVFIFKGGDMYARPKHWSPLKREYLGHLTQKGELVPPTPKMEFERGLMYVWSPDPRKNYPFADGSTYRVYEEDGTPVNPIELYERRKREPVENKAGLKFKPIDEREWDKILLPK